jgi:hypothetical protein
MFEVLEKRGEILKGGKEMTDKKQETLSDKIRQRQMGTNRPKAKMIAVSHVKDFIKKLNKMLSSKFVEYHENIDYALLDEICKEIDKLAGKELTEQKSPQEKQK